MLNFWKKVATIPIIIGLILNPYSLILGKSDAKAEEKKEKVFYYLHDHLGGIEAVTDEEGKIVERRDYLPYGSKRIRIEQDPQSPGGAGSHDVATIVATKENYGFTGKELDEETGLYYYGARYYDPLTGRFTSSDPWEGNLTNPQTLNKYSYAINNPLFYVDPTGMYIMKTGEVEKGDTLGGITSELNNYFGTNYSSGDIAAFNNISNPDKINIGDTVAIGAYNDDGRQIRFLKRTGYIDYNTPDQIKRSYRINM